MTFNFTIILHNLGMNIRNNKNIERLPVCLLNIIKTLFSIYKTKEPSKFLKITI